MDVKRILKGNRKDDRGNSYNAGILRLQKSVQSIPDIGTYTFQVVLLGATRILRNRNWKKSLMAFQLISFRINEFTSNSCSPS